MSNLFVFLRATPSNETGYSPALHLGITAGGAQGTKCDSGMEPRVNCLQDKSPPHCAINWGPHHTLLMGSSSLALSGLLCLCVCVQNVLSSHPWNGAAWTLRSRGQNEAAHSGDFCVSSPSPGITVLAPLSLPAAPWCGLF